MILHFVGLVPCGPSMVEAAGVGVGTVVGTGVTHRAWDKLQRGRAFARTTWSFMRAVGALADSPCRRLRNMHTGWRLACDRRRGRRTSCARLAIARRDGFPASVAVPDLTAASAALEHLGRDMVTPQVDVEPRVIVDLGSHIGASILALKRRYPGARIVAAEVNPHLVPYLSENVGDLEGVTLWAGAVAGETGHVAVTHTDDTMAASIKRSTGASMTVAPALTLDALLATAGVDRVDLIKIDIEGAELDVLRGFSGLRDVPAVMGEIHPTLLGPAGVAELLTLLEHFELDIDRSDPENWPFTAVRQVTADRSIDVEAPR